MCLRWHLFLDNRVKSGERTCVVVYIVLVNGKLVKNASMYPVFVLQPKYHHLYSRRHAYVSRSRWRKRVYI